MRHFFYRFFCIGILSLIPICASSHEDDHYFDSIYNLMVKAPMDTVKLAYIDAIALEHYNVDTVMRYAQMELELARKLKAPRMEIYAESYLYWAHYYLNDYVAALDHAYRGAFVADSVGYAEGLAKQYHNMAIVYSSRLMDATKGDEYYHKALDIYRQKGDSSMICDVLRDIGNSDYLYELFDEAENCYREALHIDSIIGDMRGVAEDHMGLASSALAQCEVSVTVDPHVLYRAKSEFLKALDVAHDIDYEFVKYIVSSELPEVLMIEYTTQQNARKSLLDSCRMFNDMGYEYVNVYGYDSERLYFDFNNVWYLALSHRHSEARHMADSLKTLVEGDQNSYKDNNYRLYKTLTRMYQAMGQYDKALHCQRQSDYYYRQERKKDYAITATQSMAQAKFDEQMRVQKNHEMLLEAEADRQRLLTYGSFIVLVLVSLLAAVVVRFWFASRRANVALDLKNSELEQQKEEIIVQNESLEQKNEQIEQQKRSLQTQNELISNINKQMTDSINYASVIQQAVMPSEQLMNNLFGDHLVILRPLSIVSGDFYWATQTGHYKILVVADCTGHGVPGAFLSMLGMSMLSYLAVSAGHVDGLTAGVLLDDLRDLLKRSLHQSAADDANHDGIDMSILLIDLQTGAVHYAGAFRPLVLVRDGEIKRYEPDRMPVGAHYNESDHFTNHIIDAQKGDVIYMFSDGMTDQFGYDTSASVHKFTAKRLYSLLTDIYRLPFQAQKTKIEATIDNWRLNGYVGGGEAYEQTDDAVIVGIKL